MKKVLTTAALGILFAYTFVLCLLIVLIATVVHFLAWLF